MTDWDALTAVWAGRRMRFLPAPFVGELPPPRYVVVLISDGAGRYLLANIRGRGYCAPSGRIEPDETPEAAARREAHEESGAIVAQLHPLGDYLLEPCSEQEPSPCRAPVFLARAERIEALHACSESQGVRWASLTELPQIYYDWSPLIEAVFRYAEERRESLWERQGEG
ncbi:MAG: NUDIX hydrolase [Fimbriimonadales bacterium]|nr:NUDIX hydrolase [Fimbriimonadales bacterium]